MFAYCNNNPVMFVDDSGYALIPNYKLINDGSGGGSTRFGTIGSSAIGASVVSGFINGLSTFAVSGDWVEAFNDFLSGAIQEFVSFVAPVVSPYLICFDVIKTIVETKASGASNLGSLTAGAMTFAGHASFGSTGDNLTDTLVNLTFGSGLSMLTEGVVVAINNNGKDNLSELDHGSTLYLRYITGGGGKIVGKPTSKVHNLR